MPSGMLILTTGEGIRILPAPFYSINLHLTKDIDTYFASDTIVP